jgi:hypothetical protein
MAQAARRDEISSVTASEENTMSTKSNILKYGGIVASIILIVFGVASIGIGAAGRNTVQDNLKAEKIVGTPDMTPAAIKAEGTKAGLKNVDYPTCSVAGKAVDTGSRARCFAEYMRIHALEATGGQVYSEMGRYLDANGKATDDQTKAAIDPTTKKPVENGARNLWVNETALSTALNTSYFAENVALFSMVMGVALLLTGIGFLVVSLGALERQPQRKPVESASTESGLTGSPVAG